ncbi:MAG TPA: hypothetical protein VIM43_08360 [Rugosibacter sp.]
MCQPNQRGCTGAPAHIERRLQPATAGGALWQAKNGAAIISGQMLAWHVSRFIE